MSMVIALFIYCTMLAIALLLMAGANVVTNYESDE